MSRDNAGLDRYASDAFEQAGALFARGMVEDARKSLQRALNHTPDLAEAHHLRGHIELARRRLPDARASFETSIALGVAPSQLAGELWTCSMLSGDFESAWLQSDIILEQRRRTHALCDDLPLHLRFVWDGSSLDHKTVLVRCYHGLGDTLQFIRYVPLLRGRARRIVVEADRRLATLLLSVPGLHALSFLDAPRFEPEYDVDIEVMELAHAFRTTGATIPRDVPYLAVDSSRITAALRRQPETGALRVGIAWADGSWWPERSLPLAYLQRFDGIANMDLISLQRGPAYDEWSSRRKPKLAGDDAWCEDLADTAALIKTLDLVISADSMVAHLAGALGVPVWTLLPFAADWRWMVGRSDSPWYPTMRLFRQRAPGDWDNPVEEVVGELHRLSVRGGRVPTSGSEL